MARDRKRAKQRQRSRQQPAKRRPDAEPESADGAAEDVQPEAADGADATAGGDFAARLEHPDTQDPLFPQGRPTTEPPNPVADASGVAEEAKLVIEEGEVPSPLADELAPTDEEKGRVFADELENLPSEGPIDTKPGRHAKTAEVRKDGNKLINFIKASWAELQRVQWPDRRQVAQATAVVLVFVVIAGGYLGLMDVIFSKLVNLIL